METSLRLLVSQYLCTVAAALAPVVLIAFLSIPYSLGGHPGEERLAPVGTSLHMT